MIKEVFPTPENPLTPIRIGRVVAWEAIFFSDDNNDRGHETTLIGTIDF